MKEKIGEQLIRLDILSFEQAEEILQYQQAHPKMRFGEIAVKLGFIEQDEIGKYEKNRAQAKTIY